MVIVVKSAAGFRPLPAAAAISVATLPNALFWPGFAVESTLTTSPSASSRRTFGAAPGCLAVRMPSIGVKSKMQSRPPWPMSQKN